MRKTNIEFDKMAYAMAPLLERKGVIGMVAARNTRCIAEEIQEYSKVKDELIRKYGTSNEDGSISLEPGTDACLEFEKEISPYADIKHEIDIMKVSASKVMNEMTGAEMLSVEWMIDFDEEQ